MILPFYNYRVSRDFFPQIVEGLWKAFKFFGIQKHFPIYPFLFYDPEV